MSSRLDDFEKHWKRRWIHKKSNWLRWGIEIRSDMIHRDATRRRTFFRPYIRVHNSHSTAVLQCGKSIWLKVRWNCASHFLHSFPSRWSCFHLQTWWGHSAISSSFGGHKGRWRKRCRTGTGRQEQGENRTKKGRQMRKQRNLRDRSHGWIRLLWWHCTEKSSLGQTWRQSRPKNIYWYSCESSSNRERKTKTLVKTFNESVTCVFDREVMSRTRRKIIFGLFFMFFYARLHDLSLSLDGLSILAPADVACVPERVVRVSAPAELTDKSTQSSQEVVPERNHSDVSIAHKCCSSKVSRQNNFVRVTQCFFSCELCCWIHSDRQKVRIKRSKRQNENREVNKKRPNQNDKGQMKKMKGSKEINNQKIANFKKCKIRHYERPSDRNEKDCSTRTLTILIKTRTHILQRYLTSNHNSGRERPSRGIIQRCTPRDRVLTRQNSRKDHMRKHCFKIDARTKIFHKLQNWDTTRFFYSWRSGKYL